MLSEDGPCNNASKIVHRSLLQPLYWQADMSAHQQSLSANVIVANDIPTLHVMEARQGATCREVSALRHFRLDTVEDNQSMPGSLQLPHSPGIDPFRLENQFLKSEVSCIFM